MTEYRRDIDAEAWRLYCEDTAGDLDVRDHWDELSEYVKNIYRDLADPKNPPEETA